MDAKRSFRASKNWWDFGLAIKNTAYGIKNQVQAYNPITNLIDIYRELNKPIGDEELKKFVETRNMQYMKLLWNVNKVTEFLCLSLILIFSGFLSKDDPDYFNFKIVPIFIWTPTFVLDYGCKKYEWLYNYANLILLLQTGLITVIENSVLDKFRVYEMWYIFYFLSNLYGVAHGLAWKNILGVFLTVQTTQIIAMNVIFKEVDRFLYLVTIISSVLFVALCMMIAKLVRNLLEALHENKQLTQSIKNILNALPEGVVIECIEEDSNIAVVKYANSVAKMKLFNENLDGEPVNKVRLSSKIIKAEFKENLHRNSYKIDCI